MKNHRHESIAIAGAWGYIGRHFLRAALSLKLKVLVYDPGPSPEDLDLRNITRLTNEAEFYQQQADLFHIALHPEHRRTAIDILLKRGRREPILVLCEKPMAVPEHPIQCPKLVQATTDSQAVVLFDFPELFDPMTERILEYLAGFRRVTIETFEVQRSKDREDPAINRNDKRMAPIQYQESVHCLAFVLYVLARLKGSLAGVFADGLSVRGRSEPYAPPNPEVYPRVVDGKCEYVMTLGPIQLIGRTDFKRGAEFAKRRVIRGVADGSPFLIEVDFLEGKKRLLINGRSQDDVTKTNSYEEVIKTCGTLYRNEPRQELMQGIYPNPAFAQVTYQLSSMLWRSCRQRQPQSIESFDSLLEYDAGFAAAMSQMPCYDKPS